MKMFSLIHEILSIKYAKRVKVKVGNEQKEGRSRSLLAIHFGNVNKSCPRIQDGTRSNNIQIKRVNENHTQTYAFLVKQVDKTG